MTPRASLRSEGRVVSEPNAGLTTLLICPLAATHADVPPTWEVLFAVDPAVRDLWNHLPVLCREAQFLAYLNRAHHPFAVVERTRRVMALADLAPTESVLKAIETRVHEVLPAVRKPIAEELTRAHEEMLVRLRSAR
ncbi:MAG: hypothetical protein AAGE52_00970 [Myxococcota bacterium]